MSMAATPPEPEWRDFLAWWLDYPEWAAIGMVIGAAIGLLMGWWST